MSAAAVAKDDPEILPMGLAVEALQFCLGMTLP
jgi:hypothetical protein